MNKEINPVLKDLLVGMDINSEEALLKISDKIFINERISQIKEKTTEEAFTVFVGVQIIGCWKSGGWGIGLFGNFPEIIPYVSNALRILGLQEISDTISDIIDIFPEGTDFSQNNQAYCDVINFMEGHDKYVQDKEKFSKYSPEDRLKIQKEYFNALEKAEDLVEGLWSFGCPNLEGWGTIVDYLKKNLDATLWK